ncbi:MAG: peptide deformylase [Armatimonadota bacterium]|nr:peptide deformylase [bacterium]MCS7309246.1 peptide deformylase [Armatimonadota bacterium]MDW8103847.1 peptide deformylase [Armatimonadota bacterium]MDW8289128.1 peptide deformylase [Armatimonadota bacterium]
MAMSLPPFPRAEGDPIVKYPDPILRQVAEPVKRITPEIRQLVSFMRKAMHDANGIGLAAPQVGQSVRIILYTDMSDEDNPQVHALINPVILKMAGEQTEPPEGCLSLPGLIGNVRRAQTIWVKGQNLQGKTMKFKAEGLTARIIQHEVDHLDGILFIDRADPATLRWSTEEAQEEVRPLAAAGG